MIYGPWKIPNGLSGNKKCEWLSAMVKREQAIDAAVRKHVARKELRSVLASFESGLGFAWLPYIADGIRAEFRRIMEVG